MKSTQILFRRVPHGLPTPDDFEIVETELPELKEGTFLAENLHLSLDPYMRMLMGGGRWGFRGKSLQPGELMVGRVIAEVRESKHPDFAPGDRMVGNFGWQTAAVSDGSNVDFRIAGEKDVPLTAYLGACGSNGTTAWGGLKLIGAPKKGETVLVSAAAGSVGSTVGQLARAWGCRAVGIAGGPEKCKLLTGEFQFDAACDYKAGDLAAQVEKAAPDGVDVYFDNVGGEMLDGIMPLMNPYGRIPVCGVLSQYNAGEGEEHGVKNTRLIFDKRLRLQGFLQSDYKAEWPRARAELEDLIAAGKLRYRETVAEGIAAAPEAFISMLQGGNVGKQLVKLT